MKKLFLSLLLFALVIGVSGASFASNTYINVIEAFELDSNDDIPGPPELYGYTAAGYITSYQHVNGVYMDWVSVNEGSQLGSKLANMMVAGAFGKGGFNEAWNWDYWLGTFNVW